MNRIVLALFGLLSLGSAHAQTPTTPAIAAMVCANNTVVPTPVSGQFFYVQCDSSGKLLTNAAAGGTPGGANTQVQFNDSGAFGGSSLFTFNKATGNVSLNNYFAAAASTVSGGTTTTLTASSARYQTLTGSSSQTFQLPDATTLGNGFAYVFNNNSSGSLSITNAGGSTVYTVPAGGVVQGGPTDNTTANGVWDWHPAAPATVTWGSGATGFVLNTALSTTPAVSAGTPSGTVPVFIPRRDALTSGIGAQAAGNVSIVAAGTETVRVTSTGAKIGAGSEITSSGPGGALGSGAFASVYTLPAATSSVLGGVKPDGTTITNTAGAISVAYGTGSNTAAQGNDARLGAGAVTGAIKSNGSNSFSQAACADLSNGSGACAQTYTASTWSPAITTDGTTGTPSYTIQVGSYEQIGRQITARFTVLLSGWTGSPSGNVLLSLPVASSGATNDYGSCFIGYYSVSGLGTLSYGLSGRILPGGSVMSLYQQTSTASTTVTAAQAGTGLLMVGTCTYHV
jgi:hypothetical protein